MTEPIAATGRIKLPYSCGTQWHVIHAYVRNPQLVGGTWKINSRALDENDTLWSAAAQSLADAMKGMYPVTSGFGLAELQTRSGGVWTAVDTYTPTGACAGGAYQQATQYTITFRDKLLYHFKVQLMESSAVPPNRYTSPTGGGGAEDAFIANFLSASAYPAPFHWICSRHNQFMADSNFVSAKVWLNERLGRMRGL